MRSMGIIRQAAIGHSVKAVSGIFILLFVLTHAPRHAQAAGPVNASIVIDHETGAVISANNPDKRTQPASLTKMMTLYLLFEALDSGKVTFDQKLRVSSYAAKKPATNLRLAAGSSIPVKTAIRALIIQSANDVATVVAENLGGNEAKFVAAMNRKAKQLGMKNTHFVNPSGLPDPRQVTTARDMATLATALIDRFPHHYHFFSEQSFAFNGRPYQGHNRLMAQYPGADGLKTGYVRASGYNLATSAVRKGKRLVAVVLGGASSSKRDRQMAALLDDGFSRAGIGGAAIAQLTPPKPIATPTSSSQKTVPANPAVEAEIASVSDNEDLSAVDRAEDLIDTEAAQDLAAQLDPAPVVAQTPTKPAVPSSFKKNAGWGIQVGAYAKYNAAQGAAHKARKSLPKLLGNAQILIEESAKKNGTIYLARLVGLTEKQSQQACQNLSSKKTDCMIFRADPAIAQGN